MFFAEAMEKTMKKHDKEKGDSWKNMPHEELQNLLLQEVEESKNIASKIGEWVDIANICMMIYCNAIPKPIPTSNRPNACNRNHGMLSRKYEDR